MIARFASGSTEYIHRVSYLTLIYTLIVRITCIPRELGTTSKGRAHSHPSAARLNASTNSPFFFLTLRSAATTKLRQHVFDVCVQEQAGFRSARVDGGGTEICAAMAIPRGISPPEPRTSPTIPVDATACRHLLRHELPASKQHEHRREHRAQQCRELPRRCGIACQDRVSRDEFYGSACIERIHVVEFERDQHDR